MGIYTHGGRTKPDLMCRVLPRPPTARARRKFNGYHQRAKSCYIPGGKTYSRVPGDINVVTVFCTQYFKCRLLSFAPIPFVRIMHVSAEAKTGNTAHKRTALIHVLIGSPGPTAEVPPYCCRVFLNELMVSVLFAHPTLSLIHI